MPMTGDIKTQPAVDQADDRGETHASYEVGWYLVAVPVAPEGCAWLDCSGAPYAQAHDAPSTWIAPAGFVGGELFGQGDADAGRMLEKTQLCKYFLKGRCKRGQNCTFAHGARQLRQRPDLYRTQMCVGFISTGTCGYGSKCRFAHAWEELRPVDVLDGSVSHPGDGPDGQWDAPSPSRSAEASGMETREPMVSRVRTRLRADAPAFAVGAYGGRADSSECGGDDCGDLSRHSTQDLSSSASESGSGRGGHSVRSGGSPAGGIRWADEEDDDDAALQDFVKAAATDPDSFCSTMVLRSAAALGNGEY